MYSWLNYAAPTPRSTNTNITDAAVSSTPSPPGTRGHLQLLTQQTQDMHFFEPNTSSLLGHPARQMFTVWQGQKQRKKGTCATALMYSWHTFKTCAGTEKIVTSSINTCITLFDTFSTSFQPSHSDWGSNQPAPNPPSELLRKAPQTSFPSSKMS